MQIYPRETVADVLAATDIVDVISASLELKPAGSGRLKALCPFHNEKTPSFTVTRSRQMYHCFGCGKGGDAIDFLKEHEGLSFREALTKLADKAGVRLPAATEKDSARDFLRTELLKFNNFAMRYYIDTLADAERGALGRQYIEKRHLRSETTQRFGLGFAQDGWSNLNDATQKKQFKNNVIEAAGLFKRGERGGLYDFFRNRVIFPVKDVSGNVVAFGGRDLGDSPAKYINSPETPVYKKGRVLYGLHEARDAMRKSKHALVVEGYFDVLRCFDVGIENAVASCGTALTPGQAALLRRYVPEVVLVYDGDAAGVKAALRATGVLTEAGLAVRALALPNSQDPDDFIRDHGADAFKRLLEEAPDFITFYAAMTKERTQSIEGKTEVANEIFEILRNIDDEIRLDEYLKHTAKVLQLREFACREAYRKFTGKADRQWRRPEPETEQATEINRDDCDFIHALLQEEALRESAKAELSEVALPESPLAEVLGKLLDRGPEALQRDIENEAARRLYTAAANGEALDSAYARELVEKQINRLRRDALRERTLRLQQDIQEIEQENDSTRLAAVLSEKVRIEQQMQALGPA